MTHNRYRQWLYAELYLMNEDQTMAYCPYDLDLCGNNRESTESSPLEDLDEIQAQGREHNE